MAPRLLVVDDERLIRWSLEQTLAKGGYEVSSASLGEAALAAVREDPPDLILLDLKLPDLDGLQVLRQVKELSPHVQVLIMTAYADVGTAVEAMKLGAYDYLPKPIDFENLAVTVRNALEASQLRQKVRLLSEKHLHPYHFERMVGTSRGIQEVIAVARKVARSEATTVLIQGESGTGKDLLAKAIHYEGARAEEPFMEIACTAMPETLLESELFGHERGAFTDAKTQKKGLFEVAQGGTVFLDEIGDMSAGLQAKLLRVLEERSFRRVGGTKDITVDVRVIAATNRDLRQAVESGAFRKDLYYRLQVVTITIPPLRDRREDIPLLARHFLGYFSREFKKRLPRLSPEAERLLVQYDWPGNVRELRNVIERSMILEDAGELLPAHLPPEIAPLSASPAIEAWKFQLPKTGVIMEEVEREFVRQALELTQGNQTRAARLLGLTRDELRYRVKKFGLGNRTEENGGGDFQP
ncbi:MAG: sigma-54-dependent Fis family transcriptional regulator [Candidatus Rokubacteria bacterium]|nr:sigma-54-dependent Fis family transcriptional regulator [Candidatus Rokubacteria bacterium]